MITGPLKKEELTIQECLARLETLFKSYQKDSEFNYQLSVCDSPFNQLKELVSWKPMEEYFTVQHDWVIVQFEEKDTGWRGLPKIVEFRTNDNMWHEQCDDTHAMDDYLNNICKPIAFMELPNLMKKELL